MAINEGKLKTLVKQLEDTLDQANTTDRAATMRLYGALSLLAFKNTTAQRNQIRQRARFLNNQQAWAVIEAYLALNDDELLWVSGHGNIKEPGKASKSTNPLGPNGLGTLPGADALTGVVSDALKPLFQANIWIRVGQVVLGVLLITVGVARITNIAPIATKIAKAVA